MRKTLDNQDTQNTKLELETPLEVVMTTSTLLKSNVVYSDRYMGDGKYAKTYNRYRVIKAWKKSTLVHKLNGASRQGWVLQHWSVHNLFFPSAMVARTYLRDENDEAV